MESELQRVVDALAERIGRSAAVNDPACHLLCASRHFGDEDEVRVHAVLQRDAGSAVIGHFMAEGVTRWTGPGIIPARPDLRMRARYCAPIRWRGTLLGLLMVIDPDDSLGPAGVAAVREAASTMAALMYRDFLAADAERAAREDALRRLLGPDAGERGAGHAALTAYGAPITARHATVTVVEVLPGRARPDTAAAEVALRTALGSVTRGHTSTAAFRVEGRRGVLVHCADTPPGEAARRERAERIVDRARDVLGPDTRCVGGVGDPAPGLASAWTSREQADTAARAADALTGPAGGVHLWSELGAYAVLLRVPGTRLTEALVPRPLLELRAQDPHGRLTETLAAYLDHAGSTLEAARALHLHRTSLHYRLRRIQDLTGLDLNDGNTRLTLHLGLRTLAVTSGFQRNEEAGAADPDG